MTNGDMLVLLEALDEGLIELMHADAKSRGEDEAAFKARTATIPPLADRAILEAGNTIGDGLTLASYIVTFCRVRHDEQGREEDP